MTGELVEVWVLVKFLKEHEGVYWTPYEIGKKLGSDIRTVKKKIRKLSERPWETTYKGWRLDIAERGDRLFCVRMERDMEDSGNLVKSEVSEVKGNSIRETKLNNFRTRIESQNNIQ